MTLLTLIYSVDTVAQQLHAGRLHIEEVQDLQVGQVFAVYEVKEASSVVAFATTLFHSIAYVTRFNKLKSKWRNSLFAISEELHVTFEQQSKSNHFDPIAKRTL